MSTYHMGTLEVAAGVRERYNCRNENGPGSVGALSIRGLADWIGVD